MDPACMLRPLDFMGSLLKREIAGMMNDINNPYLCSRKLTLEC